MSTYKVDFTKIKKQADVRTVLAHFGLLDDLDEHGDELTGWCPLGDDGHGKADSFSFNTTKKAFQCFACKRRGSVLDFVKFHQDVSLQQAAGLIAEIMTATENAGGQERTAQVPQEVSHVQGRGETDGGDYAQTTIYPDAVPETPHTPIQAVSDGIAPHLAPLTSAEHNVLRLAQDILEERMRCGDQFTQPEAARRFFMVSLAKQEREVFGCLFLDTRHRLICFEEMFYGTIDGTAVHPREVVRRALQLNASALICGHNHPSGDPEPSQADRKITKRVRDALTLMDIRLLDHIVVGGTDTVSMAERGLI